MSVLTRQAKKLSLEIDKGSVFKFYVLIQSSTFNSLTGKTSLEPLDLSAYSDAIGIFKPAVCPNAQPLPDYEFNLTNGLVSIDTTTPEEKGIIRITIPSADSLSFEWTKAKFTLQLVEPDGEVNLVVYGTCTIMEVCIDD